MAVPNRSVGRRAAAAVRDAAERRRRHRRLVDRLTASSLFDETWYSACTGLDLGPREAVEHYLALEVDRRVSPHPLFDPAHAASQRRDGPPARADAVDPFLEYVSAGEPEAPVHPFFDVAAYLAEHPEARRHPDGPLGHYRDVGAPAGARVNDWYLPDPVAEPGGLAERMLLEAQEWRRRREPLRPTWDTAAPATTADHPPDGEGTELGLVSVVVVGEASDPALEETVAGILAQSHRRLEVVVRLTAPSFLPEDPTRSAPAAGSVASVAAGDERVRVLEGEATGPWAGIQDGIVAARGRWTAFARAGDRWEPHRLAWLSRALGDAGPECRWVHDVAEDLGSTPVRFSTRGLEAASLLLGARPEIGTWLVRRDALTATDGLDARRHAAGVLALALQLCRRWGDPPHLAVLGLHTSGGSRRQDRAGGAGRPWLDHDRLQGHRDAVLNDHLVGWADLVEDDGVPGLVSVIVPTYDDHVMTTRAVDLVVAAAREQGDAVEVLVVDNGCPAAQAAALGALGARHPEHVRVLHQAVNRGFALGNNLALGAARGEVVVFLNNDTEVASTWLAPLRDALRDPRVLAAQSLLVYDTGTVQSAGVCFGPGGGVPHPLLQGFPREDARRLAGEPLHALTGAALAVRREDVVALRGFDPVFRNGMEDIDLCLRLAELREGHCLVVPASEVVHLESRTTTRFAAVVPNRKLFLERWRGRLPVDDARLWGRAGYRVVGRELEARVGGDNRLAVSVPVLERSERPSVEEPSPRLRWALKISAPFGRAGRHWGDTHFAHHLARALERQGQEVVVDHRDEVDRDSGRHDDVVLVLRGRRPRLPTLDQVNLMWLISHPERLRDREWVGFDHVYVASAPYAEHLAQWWPVPVSPLLQATDPARFRPGLAAPDSGHPVLFLGSSRGQRRPLVAAAAELGLDLRVIGGDWTGRLPERYLVADYLPNDEAAAAYAAAGIVLNDHWEGMRVAGFVSNRLFDAVASGARVVSDDVAGLHDLFGASVQVARTPEDLAALARHPDPDRVFGSAEQRRARAALVAAEHSFDARAEVLVRDAVGILRARRR